MKIWTYVITHDEGRAPNYERPATTLAICKPRIRAKAAIGEIVLAFSGAGINPHEPHSVCWAGVVSEVLTFAEYWNDPRFQRKKRAHSETPDNVYKPGRNGIPVPDKDDVHDHTNAVVDIGGTNVLVFKRWWHSEYPASVLPARFGLRIIGGRRGHRREELSQALFQELIQWLDGHVARSRNVLPRLPREKRNCIC